MEKPSYGWLLKWVLAAILIGVGITFKFMDEFVYLVTGMVIVIFSVFRIRSLIKTLNTEKQRTLNLIEIVLSTIVGIVLIVVGIKALNNELDPNGVWALVYKYSLVYFFAARALVYLYSVVFFEEKTEQQKFWTHVLLLPLATVIATNKNFDAEWIGWLLLLISLVGGAYLIYDGSGGYGKYRKYQQSINQKKKADKPVVEKEEVILDIPEIEEDDRPYVS